MRATEKHLHVHRELSYGTPHGGANEAVCAQIILAQSAEMTAQDIVLGGPGDLASEL